MKKSPTLTEILQKLRVAASTASPRDIYLSLVKLLAERFSLCEIIFCIMTPQLTHCKFFISWNYRDNLLTEFEKQISLTKIDLVLWQKYSSSIEEYEKQKLFVTDNEMIFRSALYCFISKTEQKLSEIEQNSLSHFLEAIAISLPTFFQISQLTKNVISYEEENDLLKEMAKPQSTNQRSELKYSYSDITGESHTFLKLLKYLDKIIEYSDKNDLIYIQGESGTGKSLLAHSIYRYSERSGASFIEVNCGAIVDNLCEAEFFGIAPNSGVTNVGKEGKVGLFELANHGVIFLDEVSELSLPMQSALLTVLEGKPFRRVCGKENIQVDVRIISASIHDIKKMPKQQFLPELAQRLDGIRLEIPPLRERKKDINQLVDYFCKQLSPERQKNITSDMLAAFNLYSWPGNIRELANCVRRCSIMGELPPHLQNVAPLQKQDGSFEDLLNIERIKIIKNRMQYIFSKNPKATLIDVAKSFDLKRDAFRRRLYDVGYTWDKIKQECLDKK
ncbi:sigma 54-interacting transcriptional regulator [Candidatus Uabimicrobium sp. HlEnr_7]|uniref:sigma 54-interacting transcriptional regulator n=1 Tax=Candidatus Uabimicrobium helgolandensis TaxID=3095367 RepID=UPI0035592A4B